MTDDTTGAVLRKMTRRQAPAAAPNVPLTASRALRLSMTRAATDSVGLTLDVAEVTEETVDLDGLLAGLDDSLLMQALLRGHRPVGLAVTDLNLVAAALEVETIGTVLPDAPDTRRITAADAAMIEPLIDRVLSEIGLTTEGTALAGWTAGIRQGNRMADVRRVRFDLSDGRYRVITVRLDMAGTDRQGRLSLVLPPVIGARAAEEPVPRQNWAEDFRATVMSAPAILRAVLHDFDLTLAQATRLRVGQVLPLPGCTVGSVRLVAADGGLIAHGRLGQMAGKMAVRVEPRQAPHLAALPNGPDLAPAMPGGGDMLALGGDDMDMRDVGGADDSVAMDFAGAEDTGFPAMGIDSDADATDADAMPMAALDDADAPEGGAMPMHMLADDSDAADSDGEDAPAMAMPMDFAMADAED